MDSDGGGGALAELASKCEVGSGAREVEKERIRGIERRTERERM